jgi:hypothetical protein
MLGVSSLAQQRRCSTVLQTIHKQQQVHCGAGHMLLLGPTGNCRAFFLLLCICCCNQKVNVYDTTRTFYRSIAATATTELVHQLRS